MFTQLWNITMLLMGQPVNQVFLWFLWPFRIFFCVLGSAQSMIFHGRSQWKCPTPGPTEQVPAAVHHSDVSQTAPIPGNVSITVHGGHGLQQRHGLMVLDSCRLCIYIYVYIYICIYIYMGISWKMFFFVDVSEWLDLVWEKNELNHTTRPTWWNGNKAGETKCGETMVKQPAIRTVPVNLATHFPHS